MGIKISELPQTTQLTSDDVVPIVQSGDTKKIQAKNIITNSHNSNQAATYSSDYINNNFNKVDVKNTETQSTTDTYSCDYIDNKIVEGDTGYTKLPDGTLICYGYTNTETYPSEEWQNKFISLPQSYKDDKYTVLVTTRTDGDYWTSLIYRAVGNSTNQIKIAINNTSKQQFSVGLNWCTIGRWK